MLYVKMIIFNVWILLISICILKLIWLNYLIIIHFHIRIQIRICEFGFNF